MELRHVKIFFICMLRFVPLGPENMMYALRTYAL